VHDFPLTIRKPERKNISKAVLCFDLGLRPNASHENYCRPGLPHGAVPRGGGLLRPTARVQSIAEMASGSSDCLLGFVIAPFKDIVC
jgi:hypothetical protein